MIEPGFLDGWNAIRMETNRIHDASDFDGHLERPNEGQLLLVEEGTKSTRQVQVVPGVEHPITKVYLLLEKQGSDIHHNGKIGWRFKAGRLCRKIVGFLFMPPTWRKREIPEKYFQAAQMDRQLQAFEVALLDIAKMGTESTTLPQARQALADAKALKSEYGKSIDPSSEGSRVYEEAFYENTIRPLIDHITHLERLEWNTEHTIDRANTFVTECHKVSIDDHMFFRTLGGLRERYQRELQPNLHELDDDLRSKVTEAYRYLDDLEVQEEEAQDAQNSARVQFEPELKDAYKDGKSFKASEDWNNAEKIDARLQFCRALREKTNVLKQNNYWLFLATR